MKLQTLGWNDRFESLFEQFRALNLQPARIVRVDRGAVTAQAELGTVTASIAGRLSTDGEVGPPAVGDWVGLDESGGGAVVRVILPRTGALSRRRPAPPVRRDAPTIPETGHGPGCPIVGTRGLG